MNLFIGITQKPELVQEKMASNSGITETLMEVGPFLTQEDAQAWKSYLSTKIGVVNELFIETDNNENSLWYGFTFEA
jgi:hypothetical protein